MAFRLSILPLEDISDIGLGLGLELSGVGVLSTGELIFRLIDMISCFFTISSCFSFSSFSVPLVSSLLSFSSLFLSSFSSLSSMGEELGWWGPSGSE